jgi:cellobiose phosphorylase
MRDTNKHNEINQGASLVPFSRILEAVAKGVELRLIRTIVAEMVTFETINLARKLEIPEEEIQEWSFSRYFSSISTEKADYSFLHNMREMEVNNHAATSIP